MIISGYLVINQKKACRFIKSRPGLNWNEISIKVNIEVPDKLFTRPMLEANIKLEGDFENKFDFEVKQNLAELIKAQENLHLVNINILPTDGTEDKEDEN